jgi:hypothetical protein
LAVWQTPAAHALPGAQSALLAQLDLQVVPLQA